jgi:hypothetical protein
MLFLKEHSNNLLGESKKRNSCRKSTASIGNQKHKHSEITPESLLVVFLNLWLTYSRQEQQMELIVLREAVL